MLVAEFAENEEAIFQQTVKWLSSKLTSVPTFIEQPIVGFQIDPFTRTYTSESGENVYLTAKEFDLLYFLFCYKGQVFTKDQLYENVWGFHNAPEGSNLTSFIQKLRKKIEPSPDNPQYILTVWGVGYKFNEEKP
ncbi:winged helix-turn-helix domain-containing protein [Clostridioides difficile]|uniref:winged helix-turn-helix domain-containing protein n=1 Tax=Clostridia TaxID=186801 RepID=UPI000516314F|nr:winged helix-turn-helix domain-containing protein [Clostridioides difficile]EKS6825533.1 winged helix-turn-helix transcriptional regulator [Clostridioides difficile]MBG0192885.1 winged helix-turn-helix transcriptional regulator [Clostridioides difficile]MBH7223711.1 winged helix-turn-helix transcriptional regulator [Clostridioides difficile]MBY1437224.1 winged helix-turn-helix domain-containing protein [Clostridioides difficile]MBY2086644.1 winged helix-turn-helix domain-containing protein 